MKVDIIKIGDIEFGERKREDYGDIDELAYSIKEKGIITPLAVETTPDELKPYKLVAGGRRYKASILAELTEIPVRIYEGPLSELDFREIELFENIHRKDLGVLERCRQERDIHELQIQKYGEKLSKSPDAPGQTLSKTGEMIGRTGEHVRRSIELANAADKFPELFEKCKTKADASKVIKQIKTELIKSELANRIKLEKENNPTKSDLSDNFVLGDFFELIKTVPDNSINLVEIDPPYAIDLKKTKKDHARTIDRYNEVDHSEYPTFLSNVFEDCYRVMAEHSWLIVWFAPEPWFELVYNFILNAGFNAHRMCGVWIKTAGQNIRPEMNLANSYEMFFYAKKGSPAIINPRGNVFKIPPIPAQKKSHPTERPVELMEEIYNTFTFPGAKILIPFLGSGNSIIAADRCNMSGFGFELSSEYKDSFLVKTHIK